MVCVRLILSIVHQLCLSYFPGEWTFGCGGACVLYTLTVNSDRLTDPYSVVEQRIHIKALWLMDRPTQTLSQPSSRQCPVWERACLVERWKRRWDCLFVYSKQTIRSAVWVHPFCPKTACCMCGQRGFPQILAWHPQGMIGEPGKPVTSVKLEQQGVWTGV